MKSSPWIFLIANLLLAIWLIGAQTAHASDIDDGVVQVDLLSGTTAADKISNCIQLFDAGTHPAGVCDARGLAGGEIDFRLDLDVPGLTLLLGSGTYDLTGDGGFRLTADGTSLAGEGDTTHLDGTMKTDTLAAIDVWNPSGDVVDNARVGDLRMTGQITQTIGAGFTLVRAKNARGVRFEGLTLKDVDKSAVNVADSLDVEVDGCVISNATSYGIYVGGSSERVRVTRNRISRAGLGAATDNSRGAIAVFGSSQTGTAPKTVHIEENFIEEFGGAGIRVTRSGTAIPSGVAIINNEVDRVAPELINFGDPKATKDGECITTSGNDVQILNNRVTGAYVNGIAVFMKQVGGTIENITIAQNRVSNSSQMPGGTNVHHGVGLMILEGQALNIDIADNILYDDQSTPTQGYGVNLNPGTRLPTAVTEDLFIYGNVADGNIQSSAVSAAATAAAVVSHGNFP